jgi:hypothetical protein
VNRAWDRVPDEGVRGVLVAGIATVAAASPAASGAPQEEQKRTFSATALPQEVQVDTTVYSHTPEVAEER